MTAALNPAVAQRLPRWTNTFLVVALGIALAWLTLKLLPAGGVHYNSAALPARSGGSAAIDPLAQARQTAEQHLFGNAEQPAPEPEVENKPVPRETRLNLQLAGVFAYQPQELAMAIISAGSGEQLAYGIGDKISGDTTLKAVYPDHVILDNRGREEILRLPDNVQPIAVGNREPAVAPSPSPRASASGEAQAAPVELPSSPGQLRDMLVRTPALLGRIVQAEPYQENGKLLGYRIQPKQNPEILEAQGILAGDVITRVNNIELNSQKQGIRALRNAVKAEMLDVTILRDGVEIPVNISLAQ